MKKYKKYLKYPKGIVRIKRERKVEALLVVSSSFLFLLNMENWALSVIVGSYRFWEFLTFGALLVCLVGLGVLTLRRSLGGIRGVKITPFEYRGGIVQDIEEKI